MYIYFVQRHIIGELLKENHFMVGGQFINTNTNTGCHNEGGNGLRGGTVQIE